VTLVLQTILIAGLTGVIISQLLLPLVPSWAAFPLTLIASFLAGALVGRTMSRF